jgi:hypothetical protein
VVVVVGRVGPGNGVECTLADEELELKTARWCSRLASDALADKACSSRALLIGHRDLDHEVDGKSLGEE